jgi:2-C-methyl-D-erythritol 4-phosphate cytidylyltransferase
MKVYALIVAAGGSERFGGAVPKQFAAACGRPLLAWTISRFEKAGKVDQIVVVVAEEYMHYTSEQVVDPYGFTKVTKIVAGGKSRRESVLKGLEALSISTDYVAIHDGVRPLTAPADIDRVIETAIASKAAILAIKATDTIKHAKDGFVLTTLNRDTLYLAQTPQVFQYDLIMATHREAAAGGSKDHVTDDASLVEARGFKVKVVEPTGPNIKVTTRDDLMLVELILTREINEKAENRPRL